MFAKSLRGIILGSILLPTAGLARAGTPSDAENHFLVGYQAYLQRNYEVCAGQLLQADDLKAGLEARAKLYLAACQEKLGYRAAAAANVDQVEAGKLAKEDRTVYDELKTSLRKELDEVGRPVFVLMPFAGTMQYAGTGNTKDSGQFFGGFASAAYRAWTLRLGVESDTITLASFLKSTSDYTQTGKHVDLARWFGSSFELRLGYSSISASDKGLDGISAMHVGGTYYPGVNHRLTMRGDSSTYPNATLGNLQTKEITAAYAYRVLSGASYSLWAQGTGESVSTTADKSTDTITKFALRSSYLRYAGDLNLTIRSFEASAGAWSGNEAFGIRDDGFVIYNSLEEHTGGWNLGLAFHFTKAVSAKVSTASESYTVSGSSLSASVYTAALTLVF